VSRAKFLPDSFVPDWLSWPETRQLVKAFAVHPDSLRFVGGAVRDSLLGRTVHDVDAATILRPDQTTAVLQRAGIKALPTGIAHGTVTAVIGKKTFEITTLRKDMACDGRHAEVAFTDDWKQDAQRRDFTMNALYLSPEGKLFDYFGGVADAKAGGIRFIGDAKERIAEDYLRILRLFRFFAHYGKRPLDKSALEACREAASNIEKLSGERIQHELLKLCAAPNPEPAIQQMQAQHVLRYAIGFGIRDSKVFARLRKIETLVSAILSLHIVLSLFARMADKNETDAGKELCARLKLSNAMAHDLQVMIRHHEKITPRLPQKMQKQAIRTLGKVDYMRLVILNWACGDESIKTSHPYHAMLQFACKWKVPQFPLTGQDLLDTGMSSGKAVGEKLRALETLWEESDYRLSKRDLLKLAN
jgi:poly(A) polymerase